MLEMPQIPLTGNEKLDTLVKETIANAIKTKILEIITDYERAKERTVVESEEDSERGWEAEDMLPGYFPANFPSDNNCEKMLETMKALYSLFMSDESWVPTLLMEYVLAKVIERGIDRFNVDLEVCYDSIFDYSYLKEDLKKGRVFTYRKHYAEFVEKGDIYINESTNVPFTEELFINLVNAYKRSLDEEGLFDENDTEEYKTSYCEEMVDNIWHFSEIWFEWLFWDWDYMLLDTMEMGTLRHSYVNEWAGILPEDSKKEGYILPEDWKNSKDFKFVKDSEVN